MSEDPDLERRLEAMFASARPRPGFEDDLWRRIEAKRPWHQRLGRRFQPALRFAPALATLLVVALGVTWLAGNIHGGPTSAGTTTSAGAPAFGNQKAAAPAFGVLPPLVRAGGNSATAPQATTGGTDTAAGGSFSGTLPSLPAELPVYRYDEPTAAEWPRIGAGLQARTGLAAIAVFPSDAARGLEPQFVFNAPAPSGPQGSDPAVAANAFLASHNLTPHFAFQISVASSGGQVVYDRVFDGPSGSLRQVRPDGSMAGLTVDLTGGSISARGPLELPLTIAPYPLRSASDALAAVNVRQSTGAAAFDRAELVYVLVVSGGHGYYEPALLLTGPDGVRLAPVIAPGWLGS
jgi:hypothetical protein